MLQLTDIQIKRLHGHGNGSSAAAAEWAILRRLFLEESVSTSACMDVRVSLFNIFVLREEWEVHCQLCICNCKHALAKYQFLLIHVTILPQSSSISYIESNGKIAVYIHVP